MSVPVVEASQAVVSMGRQIASDLVGLKSYAAAASIGRASKTKPRRSAPTVLVELGARLRRQPAIGCIGQQQAATHDKICQGHRLALDKLRQCPRA